MEKTISHCIRRNRSKVKWIVILLTLVIGHIFCGIYFFNKMNRQPYAGLRLDTPIATWVETLAGSDVSTYMQVGINVSEGKGLVSSCKACNPPSYSPFYFWGPATPWVIGTILRLTHSNNLETYFFFVVILQGLISLILVYCLSLFVDSFALLIGTALLTTICPPLQGYFFSIYLASSEMVAFLPFVLSQLFLMKGVLMHQKRNEYLPFLQTFGKMLFFFLLSGIFLGLGSLARDSHFMFAVFVAVFFAIFGLRRRYLGKPFVGLSMGLVLLLGVCLVREPVKSWNKRRLGFRIVASSSEGAIFEGGLWLKHDANSFYYGIGIGLGEYLDAEAARVTLQEYSVGRGSAIRSLYRLVRAVIRHPLKAIEFKAMRFPVLWFGTLYWPLMELTLVSCWCLVFYLIAFLSVLVCLQKGLWIPEPVYLFPLFLFFASALIHYEFRYSQPIWFFLQMAPAILINDLMKFGRKYAKSQS